MRVSDLVRFECSGGATWVDADFIVAVWDMPDDIDGPRAMIDAGDGERRILVRGTADGVISQLRQHEKDRDSPRFFPPSTGMPP